MSPDGRWAATGTGLTGLNATADNAVRVWDLRTGTLVQRVSLDARVNSVELLRAGDALLVGTSTGRVLLLPRDRAEPLLTFAAVDADPAAMIPKAHGSGVEIIAASPDGRRAYTVSDGELRAWDVDTGRLRYAVVRARDFDTLDVSPDGTRLVTCTDGVVELWPTE